jgi:hypothetical protein
MFSRSIPVLSARFRQSPAAMALAALAIAGGSGCVGYGPEANVDDEGLQAEADAGPEIAASEQALIRGSGPKGLGLTCSGGTCECDKDVENECEDLSGQCIEADLDDFIRCVEGWLTTHCSCRTALVAPPKPKWQAVSYDLTSTNLTLAR